MNNITFKKPLHISILLWNGNKKLMNSLVLHEVYKQLLLVIEIYGEYKAFMRLLDSFLEFWLATAYRNAQKL